MIKLRQKVSGCLRTLTGAQQFCAIRSYLSTAAKHGRHLFDTLVMLAEGQPWTAQHDLTSYERGDVALSQHPAHVVPPVQREVDRQAVRCRWDARYCRKDLVSVSTTHHGLSACPQLTTAE